MAQISRTSANRSAISRTIGSSAEVHQESAGERLDRLLFPDGVPPNLTSGQFMVAIANVARRSAEGFEGAERFLATERGEDRRRRVVRDEAVTELRQVLIKVRGAIVNFWGEYAAQDVGFVGNTPETPDLLLSYATNVQEKLAAGFEGYKVDMPDDLDLGRPDPANLAAAIDTRARRLIASMEDYQVEERETQAALNARDKADAAWSRHYSPVASIIEGLFRLAEMPELAERVRPTARRRAGLVEEADLGEMEEGELDVVGDEDVVVS
ncbi:hypothetical protein FRC96_00610 [Lujinxingia vulgaris]|uniref:Uncharacterized protein n=1 Tax=Lujinxingia vulgaris TaxID=2600176 RepID=A0A5C6XHY8_9DELT|nr:hypothetical protein [Lujinxingia vulgaris]TXD44285.1 hypothetical protein FRC96_00610 [Lujinxingia vulgaris]